MVMIMFKGPLYIGKLDFRYCWPVFVKLIFLLRVLVLAGWFFKGHVFYSSHMLG